MTIELELHGAETLLSLRFDEPPPWMGQVPRVGDDVIAEGGLYRVTAVIWFLGAPDMNITDRVRIVGISTMTLARP